MREDRESRGGKVGVKENMIGRKVTKVNKNRIEKICEKKIIKDFSFMRFAQRKRRALNHVRKYM